MSGLSNCDCQLQTSVTIVGFFIQVARLSTSYLVEIVCCFNLVLKIGVPFWMVNVWTMTHVEVWYMTWIWMWTMQDTNANVDWDASLSVDRDQDASLNVNQQCGCVLKWQTTPKSATTFHKSLSHSYSQMITYSQWAGSEDPASSPLVPLGVLIRVRALSSSK